LKDVAIVSNASAFARFHPSNPERSAAGILDSAFHTVLNIFLRRYKSSYLLVLNPTQGNLWAVPSAGSLASDMVLC
jgi:hypothetical protein